jgi:hypothetical protein
MPNHVDSAVPTSPGLLPDILIEGESPHSTVFILRAVSPQGLAWCNEHIDTTNAIFAFGGIVVEHRYVQRLFEGMTADGLTVRWGRL